MSRTAANGTGSFRFLSSIRDSARVFANALREKKPVQGTGFFRFADFATRKSQEEAEAARPTAAAADYSPTGAAARCA